MSSNASFAGPSTSAAGGGGSAPVSMAQPRRAFVPAVFKKNEGDAASDMPLGVEGFVYADLYDAGRLAALHARFDDAFRADDPDAFAQFDAYRACLGDGMSPEAVSEALLAAAPHVSRFVGRLFRVDAELAEIRKGAVDRGPLWRFKKDFAKKRVLKDGAGRAFAKGADLADRVVEIVVAWGASEGCEGDEELALASSVCALLDVDDVARKAAKGGGAAWTDTLRERAGALADALARTGDLAGAAGLHLADRTDPGLAATVATCLDAVEAALAHRLADAHDPVRRWPSLRAPKTLDFDRLVELRRKDEALPELFVGPDHERRERDGFKLSDRREGARPVEQEIDYCLYCHGRDKDSCSKGLREPKTGAIKSNPLGVPLKGCPLDEKISEMHVMRREGDPLAALALVTLDNPMCAGTGHRICNDCMKACVFQKQEPVNIPQVETRVLTEVMDLPWGLEIYGLLTRWNPLDVRRPYPLPYRGKNVLVVGLGPAGYTLVHHLAREGFGVVGVDGLKVEPLPPALVGDATTAPAPIKDAASIRDELDERVLLGFGGVSEYGITVRWDKNFLGVLYLNLARTKNVRLYGGVRFGGTLALDDAWALGFDHVALAAGAGRPTIIDMKNNLARGIRKASDFLMALQLTGAFKQDSLANLQVSLPAVVIGGGLTAIDTATELLAYYPIQIERLAARLRALETDLGEAAVRARFDDEEWAEITRQRGHAAELAEERTRAAAEHRPAKVIELLDRWGGVSLVYRRSLAESPAYRLNHEEVQKSLEEGVRYVENLAPVEAVLDDRRHVAAVRFKRADGTTVDLPARTVCVAAGTSPNVTYEKEHEGTFELDDRKQYFKAYAARRGEGGALALEPATDPAEAFLTSYAEGGRFVSFYGDNHPYYAGSVVKAMASAKHGFRKVADLFDAPPALDAAGQARADAVRDAFFATLDDQLLAEVVEVNRLTETIVEIVVRAPLAARKFKPGQFYRLQNFEAFAPKFHGTRLAMEGLALTGAWIDEEKGLLGTIVLEMGSSSRLCAALRPGEPVVLMGPTGAPTEVAGHETVLLAGGGLGNAVLFSIARAFKALGATVLYFAGYKRGEDVFKQDDIERWTDQVVWTTDAGREIAPRRPQDAHFRGNIVQAMVAYGKGEIPGAKVPLRDVKRILAIGSDRMMAAVRDARHGVLQPMLDRRHLAIGSINSPMQCMMKEVCAQCLQKHVDPVTKKERVVFSCFNQDQDLDAVDFGHLAERLRANSLQEKVANLWLDRVLAGSELARV